MITTKICTIAAGILLIGCEKQMDASVVPTHVVDSLHYRYPNATDVRWKAQHDKYTAVFIDEESKIEVEFNANGNVIIDKD